MSKTHLSYIRSVGLLIAMRRSIVRLTGVLGPAFQLQQLHFMSQHMNTAVKDQ